MSDREQVVEVDEMYVQTAQAVVCGEASMRLQGVAPGTLFFADRPNREVGHVSLDDFVAEWDQGENSFAEDPPNAVLTFMGTGDDTPEDAVVILRYPQADGDSITYAVEVLEGALPAQAGPCALFIDPIGRPLSAGSIAGVRRRQGRRMRRRGRRALR